MKKSEAIAGIKELIECNLSILNDPSLEPDATLVASLILYYLEETVGMYPPYDASSDDEDPQYSWEQE